MINLPSLRQLQYLVAVVELRHFGRAAERCFVTQSTLSAGIQELESLLGCRLLERSKRQVIPTALGLELARRANQLLLQARELVEQARGYDGPMAGPLRLGVIPTVGPFLLPRVLPEVRRQFPDLELLLREDQSDNLLAQLAEGMIDCAVLAFPYPVGKLKQQIFWQEDFLVALPKAHPLARVESLQPRDLPGDELLLLEHGHCLTDHALSACRLQRGRGGNAFEGTSLYTLLQMVAGGQGITFIPEMAVASLLSAGDEIVLRPLAEPGPHRRIGLVWRPTSPQESGFVQLSQLLGRLLDGT